jgi:hypothetical protein
VQAQPRVLPNARTKSPRSAELIHSQMDAMPHAAAESTVGRGGAKQCVGVMSSGQEKLARGRRCRV